MSHVRFENRQGRGGENGKFILRCAECKRIYSMLQMPPGDEPQLVQMVKTNPIVPCHAGMIEVAGEEGPFERVIRLMEGQPAAPGEFTYTLETCDGMIVGFSVMRG